MIWMIPAFIIAVAAYAVWWCKVKNSSAAPAEGMPVPPEVRSARSAIEDVLEDPANAAARQRTQLPLPEEREPRPSAREEDPLEKAPGKKQ